MRKRGVRSQYSTAFRFLPAILARRPSGGCVAGFDLLSARIFNPPICPPKLYAKVEALATVVGDGGFSLLNSNFWLQSFTVHSSPFTVHPI